MRSQFSTSLIRSVVAIVAGFVAAAAAFAIVVIVFEGLTRGFLAISWHEVWRQLSASAVLVAGAASAVLTFVGVPLWLPLHLTGRRHWVFAAVLGASVFFIAWFGPHTSWFSMPLAGDGFDAYGWAEAARDSLLVAIIGALIASIMWRFAYRKAPEAGA